MKDSIRRKLEKLDERFEEISRLLSDAGVISKQNQFRELSMEYSRLEDSGRPLSALPRARRRRGDRPGTGGRQGPRHPRHGRGGTRRLEPASAGRGTRAAAPAGAQGSALTTATSFWKFAPAPAAMRPRIFAGDLFRMYARYAESKGWGVEVLSESPGEHGGYKEIISRDHRPRRVFAAQIRVRHAPGAARARHRSTGTHSHLGVHRRDPAGAGGGRGGRLESRRPAHRYLSLLRRRRPARQQNRFGHSHHALAHRRSWWNARTNARSTRIARAPCPC